jgi:hypothetical protein
MVELDRARHIVPPDRVAVDQEFDRDQHPVEIERMAAR